MEIRTADVHAMVAVWQKFDERFEVEVYAAEGGISD